MILPIWFFRYESNNTALQISLSYCDHMVESYDVLVALMETEALDEVLTCARTSNRKSAESVARHLLSRLERREGQGRDSGLATSGLDTTWDDSSGYSHTTSSTSTTSSGLEQDFTKQDENRLREHIGRLKVLRAQVQGTVMELESVHALMLREENSQMVDQEGEKKVKTGEGVKVGKENTEERRVGSAAELETAVLVQVHTVTSKLLPIGISLLSVKICRKPPEFKLPLQELMAGREERADLRAQVRVFSNI